jgi:hypothetical protein
MLNATKPLRLGLQEALIPVGQHLGKVQRHIFATSQRINANNHRQLHNYYYSNQTSLQYGWVHLHQKPHAHTPFDYDNHYYLE